MNNGPPSSSNPDTNVIMCVYYTQPNNIMANLMECIVMSKPRNEARHTQCMIKSAIIRISPKACNCYVPNN